MHVTADRYDDTVLDIVPVRIAAAAVDVDDFVI